MTEGVVCHVTNDATSYMPRKTEPVSLYTGYSVMMGFGRFTSSERI